MIPLFVHSTGGLREAEVFHDDAAFEELSESLRQAGLASADTRVVLVRHLYDLDAVDRIHYGDLQEMLREAASVAAFEEAASPRPPSRPACGPGGRAAAEPDDEAMELRFLLGFALKRADDPFYRVPADEAGADAYFEGRMARYRMWAGGIAPLLQRCLSTPSGRDRAEFPVPGPVLRRQGAGPGRAGDAGHAVRSQRPPGRAGHARRSASRRSSRRSMPAASSCCASTCIRSTAARRWPRVDKPVDLAADLESELEDLCDALGTAGLDGVLVARGFDAHGEPEDCRALPQRLMSLRAHACARTRCARR